MTELSVRSRWPLRRFITGSVLAMAVFAVVAAILTGLALANLAHARDQVVNQADPAVQQALRLETALLDQETGVRGYALSGRSDFLAQYTNGRSIEVVATNQLHALLTGAPLADVDAVTAWRTSGGSRTPIRSSTRYGRPTRR
ncbi:MAG TPA: CHASE3 domain-containing protein [Pseudonocardiaceae bacterium]